MGRRRKKHAHFTPRTVDIDADVDDIDSKSSKFFYDEIDHFHAKQQGIDLSDMSDSETTFKKRKMYDSEKKKHYSDSDDSLSEDEIDSFSEDDDVSMENEDNETDDDDIGLDDEEDQSENEEPFADIPSSKAWGKKKSAYYGGEDVKDVRGLDREDLEDAEEEEALKIQQRLAEEIDEDQFELFKIPGTVSDEVESASQKIQKVDIDIHSLSVKAQWKLLKQESPELKELISDFKLKSNELKNQVTPLLEMVKSGKITGSGAVYVQTKFNLYLSYLVNISFYMSLKVKRTDLTGHPIIKRLAQYRTLINKFSRLDNKLEREIEYLLQLHETNSTTVNNQSDNDEAYEGDEEEVAKDESDEKQTSLNPAKQASNHKPKLTTKIIAKFPEPVFVTLEERICIEKEKQKQVEETDELKEDVSDEDEDDRRAVTDKIKKNEGFINKRKKKFGNPRVKHKEKYRKAKIQRKAMIREHRPEIQKYSGEATGIKAGLIRSRPIR